MERAVNILWRLGRLHKVEAALWTAGLEENGVRAASVADEAEAEEQGRYAEALAILEPGRCPYSSDVEIKLVRKDITEASHNATS